jgi:methylenetetrahydrofolate dehydrogenase (NADP+)/methenyltetrahydrofolate cyclohydrolase
VDTKIFDGRAFAANKEVELQKQVFKLKKRGITPKLVSILVGSDPASHLYVNLKKKAAERVGAEVEIKHFKADVDISEILDFITTKNKDAQVNGIMIQLPLPEIFSEKERDLVIETINPKKDVDGLKKESDFLTPTVKSVLFALKEASENIVRPDTKVLVVGHSGFEGGKIYKVLQEMDFEVYGVDSKTKNLKLKTLEADILISATGSPGIIKGNMIKKGAVIIDIGAPKGDVVKEEVMGRASYISPVPGGVGPVTIVSLLENLIGTSS